MSFGGGCDTFVLENPIAIDGFLFGWYARGSTSIVPVLIRVVRLSSESSRKFLIFLNVMLKYMGVLVLVYRSSISATSFMSVAWATIEADA